MAVCWKPFRHGAAQKSHDRAKSPASECNGAVGIERDVASLHHTLDGTVADVVDDVEEQDLPTATRTHIPCDVDDFGVRVGPLAVRP